MVTADGKEIKGVTLNEDSFSVQMMDASEQIYLLEKEQAALVSEKPRVAMPEYSASLCSDKDLDDIVAYLVSVGAK